MLLLDTRRQGRLTATSTGRWDSGHIFLNQDAALSMYHRAERDQQRSGYQMAAAIILRLTIPGDQELSLPLDGLLRVADLEAESKIQTVIFALRA